MFLLLGVVLIILKLTHHIDWHWAIVLLPFYWELVLAAALISLGAVACSIDYIMELDIWGKIRR